MSDADNILKWLRLLDTDPPEIFWGCVFAITASTFLALHLNVPPAYPPRLSSSCHFLSRWWACPRARIMRRQTLWSLMVIIAPELLVSLAFGDWRASGVGTTICRQFGRGQVAEWTRVHVSFANMGGLVFKMKSEGATIPDSAPYKNNGGIVRLRDIYQELNRTTLERAAEFFTHMKGTLFTIFGLVLNGLVIRPLKFLMRFLLSNLNASYNWLYRAYRSSRDTSHGESVELQQIPPSGLRPQEVSSATTLHELFRSDQERSRERGGRGRELSSERQWPENEGDLPVDVRDTSTGNPNSRLRSSHPVQLNHPIPVNTTPATELVMTSAVPEGSSASPPYRTEEPSEEGEVDHVLEAGHEHNRDEPAPENQILNAAQSSQTTTTDVRLHLNSIQIVVAQVLGILDEFQEINVNDIEEKSKADSFSKGLAIISLLWFSAKIIVKLSRETTGISQLELASCTYVLCGLISYAFYWYKPQGIERPIACDVSTIFDNGTAATVRAVTDEDIRILTVFGGSPFLLRNFVPPFGMDWEGLSPLATSMGHIPTDTSLTPFGRFGGERWAVFFGDSDFAGVAMGTGFGLLYCLGWHHQSLPTVLELWAWRFSAVVITSSLIPYSIVNQVCTVLYRQLAKPDRPYWRRTHIIHVLGLYSLLGIYVVCRLFMLVEMIRVLFN